MMDSKEMVGEMEYQRGLEDAWECVRKIIGLGEPEEIVESAGLSNFICKYSASEAIYLVEKYKKEQSKDKIEIGDEVVSSMGATAIVTAKQGKAVYLLWRDGSCGDIEYDSTRLKKTGRNFNKQINKILKELKEES